MHKSHVINIFCLFLSINCALAAMPDLSPVQKHRSPIKEFFSKRFGQVLTHGAVTAPDSMDTEPPSKLARTAIWMMVGSYVAISVFGSLFLPLAYLGLAGILGANILAILVLARKPNRKSRVLARIVLITTGIMVAGVLAILGAIKLLFPGAT